MDRNKTFSGFLVSCIDVALRKESVDRNTLAKNPMISIDKSLSARRAWIEMYMFARPTPSPRVALRKESVDRNLRLVHMLQRSIVALRKESVDRNAPKGPLWVVPARSLSARRAWIEMQNTLTGVLTTFVALRKESVDRNIVEIHPDGHVTWSLSARRAWIEIPKTPYCF